MSMFTQVSSTLELSGVEKIFCTHGSWMTICYAAHLSGNQSIIVNNIRYAIPLLLKRYSRMRSRLQINGYQQLLEVLDYDEEYFDPKLFYSIEEKNDQSWQELAEAECHRNPYTNNGQTAFPLFHFMLLLDKNSQASNDNLFHILLFSNHSVSDGRTGFFLINDLLTLVTSPDLRDHVEPVNTEIIPFISQFIPRSYGVLHSLLVFVAKYIAKHELRALQHPRIPVKTTVIDGVSTPFRLKPVRFHFLFTSTSTTLSSRLREKCHSQQVTLHGPLLACLMLAIHHCFPQKKTNGRYFTPFPIDVDFDLRSRLPASPYTPSTVGYCVGLCTIKLKKQLPLMSTAFWTVAKECRTVTNKVLTNGDLFLTQHFLNNLLKNEEAFNDFTMHCPDGRVSEVNFSNIGKYPFACDYGQGQLRLRGLHIVNTPGVYHTSSVVFVTCAGDGQLDITLAHEMECEEKADEFLRYYIHLLEKCADADIGITLEQLLEDN